MAIDPQTGQWYPDQPGMMESMLPVSEPDYQAELNAPQAPQPNDFFSRLAIQSGGQGPFGPMNTGRHTSGLEGLAALFAGFINGKTVGAQHALNQVEQQNQRARENAKALAQHRWNQRNRDEEGNRAIQKIMASGSMKDANVETIVGPNGKPMIVPRAQAIGKERYYPPPGTQLVQTADAEGNAVWTRKSDAEGKPAPQGRKKPSSTERERLVGDAAVVAQAGELEDLFNAYGAKLTGPINGPITMAKLKSGVGLTGEEATFAASVAQLRDKTINQLSGAQTSLQEVQRVKEQIPTLLNPPRAFLQKLKQTKRNQIRLAQLRRKTYEDTGLDMSDLDPLPEFDPAIPNDPFAARKLPTPGVAGGDAKPKWKFVPGKGVVPVTP